jgi:hypothetical protein
MHDYDVGAVGLTTPPPSAVLQAYRPAVSVRNNGIHDALASGTLRIYKTGLLVFTTELYSGTIPPGETRPALATDYWTPDAVGVYQFIAYVSCPLDQYEPNNSLPPTMITVTSAPPPPPPAVPLHATQHEEGGTDEVHVDGLSGELADDQPPKDHAGKHEQGGADQLVVSGLSGKLADAQTPLTHKTTHQFAGADEVSIANLAGNPAARGQPGGLASLNEASLVPNSELATNEPSATTFLSAGRKWSQPPTLIHAPSHLPDGKDPVPYLYGDMDFVFEPYGFNDGFEHEAASLDIPENFLKYYTTIEACFSLALASTPNPASIRLKLYHIRTDIPPDPRLLTSIELLNLPGVPLHAHAELNARITVTQPGATASFRLTGYAQVPDLVTTHHAAALSELGNFNANGTGRLYLTVQYWDTITGLLWEQRLGSLRLLARGQDAQ